MSVTRGRQRTSRREVGAREARREPILSVVLISLGSRAELERAVRVIADSVRQCAAQLVVVRRTPEPTLEFVLSDFGRVDLIRAADGCSRAELCELGMSAAYGDVVFLREDTALRDTKWLEAFQSTFRAGSDRPLERLVAPTVAGNADVNVSRVINGAAPNGADIVTDRAIGHAPPVLRAVGFEDRSQDSASPAPLG